MAQAVDDVGAAVPLGRLAGSVLERRGGAEEQQVPAGDREAEVQRERQPVGRRVVVHRRDRLQIGQHGVGVGAADVGELRIGQGGVEVVALVVDPLVQGAVELVRRPGPDAGLLVGGDVGRVDHPEGRVQPEAAGEGLAAVAGVAGHAVAHDHQVLAAAHLVCVGRGVRDGPGLHLGRRGRPGRRGGHAALAEGETGEAEHAGARSQGQSHGLEAARHGGQACTSGPGVFRYWERIWPTDR